MMLQLYRPMRNASRVMQDPYTDCRTRVEYLGYLSRQISNYRFDYDDGTMETYIYMHPELINAIRYKQDEYTAHLNLLLGSEIRRLKLPYLARFTYANGLHSFEMVRIDMVHRDDKLIEALFI